MSTMTILTVFPTSAPAALGGTTAAVLMSNSKATLQGKAVNGSATVALLAWHVALGVWDYVFDPQSPGARLSVTPSSRIGGLDSKTFDNPAPTHYAALLTTSAPSGDTANLTIDLSAAAGSSTQGKMRMWSKNVNAKGTTAVHAAYAGNNATNAFPGPITNPGDSSVPRNLSATAGAGYDGGALTVVGIDQFDQAVTEVITPVAGSTVYGAKVFKNVTSITKATVGGNAATVSVSTGDVIGLSFHPENSAPYAYLLTVNGVAEPATAVYPGVGAFTPTTVPASQTFNFSGNASD